MSASGSASLFRRYLLPGFVFQSVVIAGGYGTGRELVEFFLAQGPRGALLAVAVTTVIWSAVAMASFEFARVFGTYDYRSFFKRLLGPAWVLFEIAYLLLLLIVLAVVASASGEVLRDTFDLPYWIGVAAVMCSIGALVFGGNATIERALAGWSFVLYGLYALMFVWALSAFGGDIADALASSSSGTGWAVAGVSYAGYNLAVIPAAFFALRYQTTRREALVSGALTGVVGILPGLLLAIVMIGLYPEILDAAVPATIVLDALGSRAFQVAFQVVLFGTLIETGTGLIHAVNERWAHTRAERGASLPPRSRVLAALALLGLGTALSGFGLIDLIARGYGTLTWAFIVIFVIPILTVGVMRIRAGTFGGSDRPA